MTIDYSTACSFILGPSIHQEPEIAELRRQLETGNDEARIQAIKSALCLLSTGQTSSVATLLMTIIRFVLPNQKNKLLKKLVLLFFEMIPKTDGEGKLLSEMILLCNALRNDLQHPNEYVRGVTLRFLTRIGEAEILEPLIPSVRSCLEHRHVYVRRNAILALASIYRTNDFLVPDTPELVQKFITNETDSGCLRNAFVVLCEVDPSAAWNYYASLGEQITTLDASLQLAILNFIKTVTIHHPEHLQYNTRSIIMIMQSSTLNVVKFEAALVAMSLSSSSIVIGAVASTFIDLAVREPDTNAKMMILDRYSKLQSTYASIVNEDILNVQRVLAASDFAVRQRAIQILGDGVTAQHAPELVSFFIKELGKSSDYDRAAEYKQSLLSAIDSCAARYPSVAPITLDCCIDLLSCKDASIVLDAIRFTKEILEKSPVLQKSAISRLLERLDGLTDPGAVAGLFWIIGEFSSPELVPLIYTKLQAFFGPLPMSLVETDDPIIDEKDKNVHVNETATATRTKTVKKVNADGTYATETALTSDGGDANRYKDADASFIKSMLIKGNYQIATAIAVCICKLASHQNDNQSIKATFMLMITSMIKLGMSPKIVTTLIDKDTYERLMSSLKYLAKPSLPLIKALAKESHRAFELYLASTGGKKNLTRTIIQPDDQISFRLGKSDQVKSPHPISDDESQQDVLLALGQLGRTTSQSANLLSRVVQLTGFSDEIYAETYVTISHSDIILDILLVNQTSKMLQNVTIELCTKGDLSVSEKPVAFILAPNGFTVVKASLKVKSTDNGIVFGSITYGLTEPHSIIMATINIDIASYIQSSPLTDTAFRSLWPTLEWENKIVIPLIHKEGITLNSVINEILTEAKLYCITPGHGVNDTKDYLAANLHATTLFDEEILANICLEASTQGISGHLRLRSKTQGIAIALGDRITEIVNSLSHSRPINNN